MEDKKTRYFCGYKFDKKTYKPNKENNNKQIFIEGYVNGSHSSRYSYTEEGVKSFCEELANQIIDNGIKNNWERPNDSVEIFLLVGASE